MLRTLLPTNRQHLLLGAAVVFLATSAPMGASFAQAPGAAGVPNAVQPPASNSVTQSVATFKTNPEQMLTTYPKGGDEMISRVREFALNDTETLSSFVALLGKANADQKAAIAQGLGQAAKIIVRTNQDYAGKLRQAVLDTNDKDLFTKFAEASGDVGTAATAGAGAGSPGASGGQTTTIGSGPGAGGAAEAINGSSTNTGAFSFTSSVTGIGNNSTTGTTTTTTTTIGTTSP
jgi:hypothetical protein